MTTQSDQRRLKLAQDLASYLRNRETEIYRSPKGYRFLKVGRRIWRKRVMHDESRMPRSA